MCENIIGSMKITLHKSMKRWYKQHMLFRQIKKLCIRHMHDKRLWYLKTKQKIIGQMKIIYANPNYHDKLVQSKTHCKCNPKRLAPRNESVTRKPQKSKRKIETNKLCQKLIILHLYH